MNTQCASTNNGLRCSLPDTHSGNHQYIFQWENEGFKELRDSAGHLICNKEVLRATQYSKATHCVLLADHQWGCMDFVPDI